MPTAKCSETGESKQLFNKVRRCDQVIIVLLHRGHVSIVYALMHSVSLCPLVAVSSSVSGMSRAAVVS